MTHAAHIPELQVHNLPEVEELTHDLKCLLVKHETVLSDEGIRDKVETLEELMESYRRGLSAAEKLSGKGTSWLTDVRDHLKLAVDAMQRLENESNNPANSEQTKKTEDLLKAIRGIDKVIPDIEHMFSHKENEDA